MGFLKNAFSEADGTPSSMRLVLLLVVGAFLFNWCYSNVVSMNTGAGPVALDLTDITMLLGAFGFKYLQKSKEVPKEISKEE